MATSPTFAQLVAAAKRHTPGGRFNKADIRGLTRRGISMGLSATEIRAAIVKAAPLWPVTRGIK